MLEKLGDVSHIFESRTEKMPRLPRIYMLRVSNIDVPSLRQQVHEVYDKVMEKVFKGIEC